MGIKIKMGSEFISMTKPENKPWLREVYWGMRDGTGRHGHLSLSGSVLVGGVVVAETWYARPMGDIELVKNGSEVTNNTSQLLSDCIPDILREFQHPGKPLSWNVGSLDSFFLSQKKHPQ